MVTAGPYWRAVWRQLIHPDLRDKPVMRKECATCGGRVVYGGHGPAACYVSDGYQGPECTYFDCEPCDTRWCVQMDERDPREFNPRVIRLRLQGFGWPVTTGRPWDGRI